MKTGRPPATDLALSFDAGPCPEDRVRELEAERDALVEQVIELQRAAESGLLTAGLAHDIENQLTALMGAAELAMMQGDPESMREGLRGSLRHGWRVHETVDAFLQFVRRRECRERVFAVREAMDSIERLLGPVARAKGVDLVQSCATNASICADRQLVEQVLVNLAMNALRAASGGAGRVVLSATDDRDGFVRFAVRDTGPGIRPEVMARLFQPFATGHASSGGTGLGLYIVRQIVQRYGGTVRVDSSAAGTRIEVDLPVAA